MRKLKTKVKSKSVEIILIGGLFCIPGIYPERFRSKSRIGVVA